MIVLNGFFVCRYLITITAKTHATDFPFLKGCAEFYGTAMLQRPNLGGRQGNENEKPLAQSHAAAS